MKLTIRNVAAMMLSFWYIITGNVNRSIKKALAGEYILSVYFHDPGKKLFTDCIKWLMNRGFHFISIAELELIQSGQLPFPKGAVLITVDDGWKSNKENIIDVVRRLNIPVAIFLTVDPVMSGTPFWWSYIKTAIEKGLLNLSISQLKEMDDDQLRDIVKRLREVIVLGREAMTEEQIHEGLNESNLIIGSHTVTHPILPKCNEEKVYFELKVSKERLEHTFNQKIYSFAYPNGSYTNREINILKDTGYRMAFNTNLEPITPDSFLRQYELPRMEVINEVSFLETICRMTGVWKGNKKN